ncbi:MAG: translation initiation factor IF-3 [Syntrophomonadaceae bacterium]|nr:translation initiation factor IF-3 [Syntrophomonadaceae bacterium]MDH7498054.1 translation initiation factor IF-3 [Syntrophomonadaceae bacterium]
MRPLRCFHGGEFHISKDWRINEEIRVREVRLIDENGEQVGIVPTREALQMSIEKNLDLVEIAPGAKPPVCRLMDYGKFRYEQSKRDKEARKKQRVITVKEVKMRPNIEQHDFLVKAKNAERFLLDGDKVKVTIMFRGREISHPQLGHKLCVRLAEQLASIATVEREPKLEGRNMTMVLNPRPDVVKASEAAKGAEPAKAGSAKAAPAAPGTDTAQGN